MAYDIVDIDKLNKPQEFRDLYASANPLPGARAKVPLLEIRKDECRSRRDVVVLCESRIIADYVAERYNILLPPRLEDRAVQRLLQELCGSTFSYLGLLRAQSLHQMKTERNQLQDRLVLLDKFLSAWGDSSAGPFLCGSQFTLAESNLAPFLQRCCSILPKREQVSHLTSSSLQVSFHPLAICSDLGLVRLEQWINAVLSQPSVIHTGPPSTELNAKRGKLLKRIARLHENAARSARRGGASSDDLEPPSP